MDTANDINNEIFEIYNEKQKYENEYHNLMTYFLDKAHELVDLSNDTYQIEHTIKLNKISLKDYVLNSNICKRLRDDNINNYSIDELKNYINNYEKQNIDETIPYNIALELYVILENIEELEKSTIDLETNKIAHFSQKINNIKYLEKEKLETLYNEIKTYIKINYLDNNNITNESYHYIIKILNDIFNYYLYGNKEIPLDK